MTHERLTPERDYTTTSRTVLNQRKTLIRKPYTAEDPQRYTEPEFDALIREQGGIPGWAFIEMWFEECVYVVVDAAGTPLAFREALQRAKQRFFTPESENSNDN